MEISKELSDLTIRKVNIEKHLREDINELFEFGGSHEYLEAISFLFTTYTESEYVQNGSKDLANYSFSMTRLMMFLSQLEVSKIELEATEKEIELLKRISLN